jgi:hypothetical protein
MSRVFVYSRAIHIRRSLLASVCSYLASTTIMAPGQRSEEVWLWYTAVYEAIQEIPHGKVTSYGHIARLVGKRTYRAA